MSLDQYFKELKVETEEDLYKQSFRSVAVTRAQVEAELIDEKAEKRKRRYAFEALWFFISLLLAAVLAYAVYQVIPGKLANDVSETLAALLESAEESGSIDAVFDSAKEMGADKAAELTSGEGSEATNNLVAGADAKAREASKAAFEEAKANGFWYLLYTVCFLGIYVIRAVRWSMTKVVVDE